MYFLYKLAKYKTILTIAVVMVLGLLLSPLAVGAASGTDPFGIKIIEGKDSSGGVKTGAEPISLGTRDLRETVTSIINVALTLLGIVAVVIILIGGFRWMTAGGNDEKVTEARKWIFSGIIGLAIVLSAWAIAKFVLLRLGEATSTADFNVEEY